MPPTEEGGSRPEYRSLDPDKLVDTIARLSNRIRERFPDAGLWQVSQSLLAVAKDHARRSAEIHRPLLLMRSASVLLLVAVPVLITYWITSVHPTVLEEWHWLEVIQTLEAGLGALFFMSTGVILLVTLEIRMKRRRCLHAIHEMRSMAHIVDMHQLTKDPERARLRRENTPASPEHRLTNFQLVRYLDYCSEMLSLIGKISALYVQGLSDSAANSAVDEVEALTTGLSRKIWQKIMILDQRTAKEEEKAVASQDG